MHIPSEIWDLLQTCPEPVTAFVAKLLSDKEQLEQENARLRAQINQNSSNSHIPPSKNIFKKITSLRPKTGRKPGGQPGHKGSTLHRSEKPNVIIEQETPIPASTATQPSLMTHQLLIINTGRK
jgi:hypothetical protein